MDDEQQENLERVNSRIEHFVLEFCRGHRQFHADDLRQYVAREALVAPASADRILRYLRQRKQLDYVVLNRRESLYQVLWVKGDKEVAA